MPRVWSIVVAGGTGSRFGAPKQFASLAGRSVLEWAVQVCRPGSDGVVVVVPARSAEGAGPTESGPGQADGALISADVVVTGGATRDESVRRGLAAVPPDAEVIVVHDAARPLATPALFDTVVAALAEPGVEGAVPGSPPGDTIKVVDEADRVTTTLDRADLRAVQTPQAFRAEILRRAHRRAVPGATDDAMVVEALGGTVQVVPGEPENLKITAPRDLWFAERIVSDRLGAVPQEGRPA